VLRARSEVFLGRRS